MAISIKRYVDIISGVGAGAEVATRSLGARIFTTNPLVPTHAFVEFNSSEEVGLFFGFSSEEYAMAQFYFGWISKNITAAQMMSFARWVDEAVPPQIFGARGAQTVASYTGITAGAFTLEMGGVSNNIDGLNFSAAVSLSDVANVIQTEIRTNTGGQWTAATVQWDAVRQSFNLIGGADGPATISITPGTGGSDVSELLGWDSATTIFSDGSAVQTIPELLTESADSSNNFGSFAFVQTLTEDQIVDAAEWNRARNNEFMYSVPVTASNASDISAATLNIGGVTLTLAPLADEYPELVPMMILAATDYSARNATQNYMFQFFDLTPSVNTDADANIYDNLLVNYYGQTQTAGNLIQFYQRGIMMGLPTDPRDQNTYANEIWLKDALAASILTLLLALAKVSANRAGRAQLLAIMQEIIDLAVFNGTISVGKTLDATEKLFITNATGDAKAWYQVQNQGYWLDGVVQKDTSTPTVQYKFVYTLIYSKDDVIRKVEGRDILI